MNLIDLLLQLQIPLWAVLLLSVIGIVVVRYYTYKLDQAKDRNSKQLEHNLEIQKLQYEKTLELLQERYRDRLNAIDKVSAALQEFNHSVIHIRSGDTHEMYYTTLNEKYYESRKLAREYETLFGAEFYQAISKQTDKGLKILDANFIITQQTIDWMKRKGIIESAANALVKYIDKPIPLTQREKILAGLKGTEKQVLTIWLREIVSSCIDLSETEFDYSGYLRASDDVRKLIEEKTRILPLSIESP